MWSSSSTDKFEEDIVMKKKSVRPAAFAALVAAMVMTAGCGASGSSAPAASYDNAVGSNAKVALYEEAAMADEAAYDSEGGNSSAGTVADTSRKLITTMTLNAETDDLAATVSKVENKIKELGGYIESSNMSNNANYSSRISRSASMTARIPKENLDAFVELVEGSTNITDKSVNVDDVTLSYVDTESRKNALKTEEKRLLEILENAETVEDLITVESRLADVRYELESIESQLRSYDNKIDFSTVYLYIDEVVTFTPVEKESAATRMGKGFMQSVNEVKEGIVEFAIWFVVHIPQILVLLIIALIIILIIRLIDKGSRKKRIKRMQKMGAQGGAPVNMVMTPPVQQMPNPQMPQAPVNPQKENTDGNK